MASTKKNRMDRNPLIEAVIDGRVEDAHRAVSEGVDPKVADKNGWTPLHFASRDHNVALVRWLLGLGVPVDPQDSHGQTPLARAAFRKGGAEVLRLLLAAGADRDTKNRAGNSPADLARTTQDPVLLELLTGNRGSEPLP